MARFSPLAVGAVACAAVATVPLVKSNPVLIWNASPSVPMGLYQIEKRSPGRFEIAVIRLPKWASALANQRQYLPSSAVLIKPIAATEGDIVCRFGGHVFVNGRLRAKAFHKDKMKRPLPSWKGCLRLRTGQIFVLSKRNDSFDSRYFGAIGEHYVLGTGRLIFSAQ